MSAIAETKWDDSYYARAYALARDGLSDEKLASCLGVTAATLLRWRRKHPALQKALDDGRKLAQPGAFVDYVYKRLPENLQGLWDRLVSARKDRSGNALARAERLLERAGLRARQSLFVHALVCRNFNQSEACSAVNVSRQTLRNWLKNDPDFAALIDEVRWHKANFFEGAFCALVAERNPAVVIHAARTYNAKRGYGQTLKVEHGGTVAHAHSVRVDDLGLPIEVRRQLLEALQNRKALPEHVEDAEFEVRDGRGK